MKTNFCFVIFVVELLAGIRGDDVDLLDHDPLGWFTVFAHAVSSYWSVADLSEHLIAFDQLTEGRVLMIESWHWRETNEKLGAGRIWVRFARHRDHTALMSMIVEFRFEFVTRAAFTVAIFFARIFRVRVATLNHESFHDPMNSRSVVKT